MTTQQEKTYKKYRDVMISQPLSLAMHYYTYTRIHK